ncbi:MAG: S1 RNA-binding domain-containing protein [Bdellovibrionales bacterium]|jgi:small subunit ribosomal protein S1|nr:S1 RNA-binding domain-containing protein [Bdellovibrionales bacterium]
MTNSRSNSKKTDIFGDEVDNRSMEDFASLFEQSEGPGRRFKSGDALTGEILSIGKESSFISTGTMNDAQLPTLDLKDKDGKLMFNVGDQIKVKVVRAREGELLVKRFDSTSGSDDIESLEDAFDLELPVKGKVTEAVKGGYRVEIQGKRAFCPFSQIDLRASNDPADYVGKSFEFIITQLEARNLVVSRRKLLELQRAEGEGAFMLARKPGDRLNGTITRLENFGAFCLLDDGVEGLIPISELAWGRVSNPAEVVRTGQTVSVILTRVSEENDRLRVSLSLKQAGGEGDPWLQVNEKYPMGSIHEGTVERRENYGLFVNLAPGITGLLPRSKWRDSTEAASFENKKRGDTLKVMVSEINFADHKLTLAPPADFDDGAWRAHTGSGKSASKGMGTFADLFANAGAPKAKS